MKCPHCDRDWDTTALDAAGMSPQFILQDHVNRFCSGHPATPPKTPHIHVARVRR